MGGRMTDRRLVLTLLAISLMPAVVWARQEPGKTQAEDEGFTSAAQMFQDTGRDKLAVVQAFENYVQQYPNSQRYLDAEFMIGEAYMQQALSILEAEATKLLSGKHTSIRAPLEPTYATARLTRYIACFPTGGRRDTKRRRTQRPGKENRGARRRTRRIG